jgi:predicted mannosyl-3-phosphoglycerate phosphatase (HAD superfamily)
MQVANKQRPGRPVRKYTVSEISKKVESLREELAALTKSYADGTATLPFLTEKEILRVSRALARENAILQSLLADEQTRSMF